jgi:hypothetical protein
MASYRVAEQTEITWAHDTAAVLIGPLGRRWAHAFGVVERARSCSDALPAPELDVLVAAACMRDIGYEDATA